MIIQEEVIEKSQIEREHMARVKAQNAAEEEALKFSRTIKGADLTKYKNRKYKYRKHLSAIEQELSDKKTLKLIRFYQLLSGFIGLVGTGIVIMSIDDTRSLWPIFENSIEEMNLLWPGFVLTAMAIVVKIGFQHKHDKISDRLKAGYTDKISAK